ncbi:MAG TPA: hypothetical protein DDX71_04415 [Ruminococcus sp.]|nr:hypothetical protein [Ruminococcus sp.]
MSDAQKTINPFNDEKPQLVHFEADESHYEYCRMQMHEIDKIHRRTFLCDTILCIMVCLLSVFKYYIAGFDLFSRALSTADRGGSTPAGATLAAGMFEILVALFIIVLGYLAWANFHTLNMFLGLWYAYVTLLGIMRLDVISAVIGVVGVVFYVFSFRAMTREQSLSEMPGYPNFQEKFDISKSDIVIQTLLAHQGERRTKSTLFTTDYSLRRKKKKPAVYNSPEAEDTDSGKALALELQKHIDEARDARQARTAIAVLDAAAAAQKREKEAAAKTLKSAAETVSEPAAEETVPAAEPSADESAAAIIAEAEAKAKEILAEALAKAEAIKSEQTSAPAAPAKPKQQQQGGQKKKKKH